MAESYYPLDEIEADYSSEKDAAPFNSPFPGSARYGSQPPPSSSPKVQGQHKVKKKAPPVPPKKPGRQYQLGNFPSERGYGFMPVRQNSFQNDFGHHNEAFHDDSDALLRDGFSGNVNRTSADVPHDKTGPPLQGFSYLPNSPPPVFPQTQKPPESPPVDFRVPNQTRSRHQDSAALASETYQSVQGSGSVGTAGGGVGTAGGDDSDIGDEASQRDEDLAGLECLDNDILLGHLRTRFDQQQPYTYLGDSLVAVNPCKPLNILTKELHGKYRNLRVRSKAPAHIFWVASQVLRNLLTTGRSQCVVVGGDSGAGKTESIKYILNHLVQSSAATATSNNAALGKAHHVGRRDREPSLSQDIVGKLEKVNPLVELFGNASTVLNENSSRFGKLVELEYDEQGNLSTARLECFMLEKFRVTSRNPVEKNFHVFYALFAGLSSQRLSELGLDLSAESYRILKPWDFTDGVFRTEEEMQRYSSQCALLDSILPDIGFDADEITSLFKMLSAILILSNVEFEHPDPDVDDVIVLDGMGEMHLERAVEVLGLGKEEAEDFENSLLRVSMEIKGEKMVRHKTLRQARDGRDALARELYAVLFYGVIDKINNNLCDGGTSLSSSSRRTAIRLLDISGFENVEHRNSFEQFIINSTNERLQQFFLQRTFRHELDDYVREDITPVDVTFQDNAEIVQLIFAKPEGLIPLLEDEISTNGTDQGWLTRCDHRSSPTPHFTPQPAATAFLLLHYAGKVQYSAEGFVTKNSDTVHHNLREVVQQSENTFIKDYFIMGSDRVASLHKSGRASFRKHNNTHGRRDPFGKKGGGSFRRTGKLTGRFTDEYQKSLSEMMSKLQTDTLFVRCIKPNLQLKPNQFQAEVVREQLLSCGLLEVIKIRRDGYPIRAKFADFVTRYKDLLDNADSRSLQDETELRRNCDVILASAGVTGHQMGHSKVFLKMNHRDQLDAAVYAKLKERERQAREERERQEREERARAEKERGGRMEDEDTISTVTTPSFANTTESGFQSDRNQSKSESDTKMDPLSEESESHGDGDDEGGGGDDDDDEKEKPKKKKEGLGNQPAYNIFRLTERDFENSTDFEMKIRRGIRLILYFLIFSLILAGGVVSRIALVWLSSSQLKDQHAEDARVILRKISDTPSFEDYQADVGPTSLLLCHFVPFFVGWLACVGQVAFGRHDWPSFKALILVTLLDCAGVVGRSVFLYKVLPKTDFLTALMLGTAVCQIPAVLSLVSHVVVDSTTHHHSHRPPTSRRWARVRHTLYLVLLVLAVLVQLGTVPLTFFSEDLIKAITGTTSSVRMPDLWAMIVATLCSSSRWWGNYAYGKIRPHKHSSDHHVRQGLSKWRLEMDRIRRTSFVYTGPVQMIVLVALFFGLNGRNVDVLKQIDVLFRSLGAGFSDGEVMSSHFAVYNLVYLHLAATIITPYLSGMACRVYMQRFAFAAPIMLVAPACMALTFACTPYDLVRWYEASKHCVTADVKEAAVTWMLVLGVLVWLSVVVINQHVWFPEVERTAKMERLFFYPYRDPIFLDISLQCSRRQDKMENAERHRQHKKWDGKFKEGIERPTVYICATMWHEVRQEMVQLLKSLLRVDFDVYTRRKAMSQFQILEEYSDLYDPEIHIIFDDAFETDSKSKQRVINSWVRQFIEVMPEAMGSVAKRNIDMQPPTKIPTPYGGRLQWTLPGGTLMFVHLKDKDRIRHRKRWSQVMYLYYLLGYRLMADYKTVDDALHAGESKLKNRRRHRVRKNTSLLNNIAPGKVRQADNIFLMTLDGDVDFRPDAVRLLLDCMKKNKKVAAVCGRIHPIGDGPMVWYQKFEYAVGHWLQKAAEHVFGCVLCCPGCFSLFRGSALMDDNVMRMYTTEPTEALHFIQYEQGEDRWLCTLLLQQGWKIEYCAGADALTFAPETFHDFYIQRRRWSPSTLANIMDLIGSWRITVKMNDNISVLFMLYQFVLMTSSIIAPGLVVFLIAESYNTVLSIDLEESYILSVVPVFLYILLCLKAKTQTQINVAAVLSSVYAIIMLLVTIGTIINVASSSILSPDVLFLVSLAVIFIFAGFIHPNELFCLFHGLLYYLTVPSTFVFLTVFFLCNLNVVTWGTREGPKKVDPEQEAQQPVQEKGKLYKLFEKLGITAIAQDLKTFVQQMVGIREQVQPQENQTPTPNHDDPIQQPKPVEPPRKKVPPPVPPKPKQEPVIEKDHTYWIRQLDIPNSTAGEIESDENEFWTFLLDDYLHPIKANKEQQDKISADLITARNNVVFGYMLLNLMFTLVLLQLRTQRSKLEDTFYIAGEYEPVSTLSLLLFSLLLLIQLCGMLSHRWGTFLHLIASTRIAWFATNEEQERALTAIQEAQKLTSANAEGDIDLINPDYSDDDDDDMGDDYTTAISSNASTQESGNPLNNLSIDPEEAPDYSDSEEEEEAETQFGSVQYDTVFNRRFRNVRRHIAQQNRPPRTQLYEKNPASVISRPTFRTRHPTRYERRQSLYITNPQDLWRSRRSVLHM